MIDAYAGHRHYLDHILPVWERVPEHLKGNIYTASDFGGVGIATRRAPSRGGPLIVAGYEDYRSHRARPIIYVEHGIGQSYDGDEASLRNPCYSGGSGLDRVVLFITPNDRVGHRWNAAYPQATVVVAAPAPRPRQATGPRSRPVVAVTFHWDGRLVPETRSAWAHYDAALDELARDDRFELLGHGHPRIYARIARRWSALGVRSTPDLRQVLDEADLLVGDNTSALYQFAATDRPVVVLDAPWYRRDVDHGLRFWSHADVGVRIVDPAELANAIVVALADPPEVAQRRREISAELFPPHAAANLASLSGLLELVAAAH